MRASAAQRLQLARPWLQLRSALQPQRMAGKKRAAGPEAEAATAKRIKPAAASEAAPGVSAPAEAPTEAVAGDSGDA